MFYCFIMNHLQNNQASINYLIVNMDLEQVSPALPNLFFLLKLYLITWMRACRQVDMILLDFSKAFDTVPHHRLLLKLKY